MGGKSKINAGLAHLGNGDFEKAIKYYQQAKALAPEEPFIKKVGKTFEESYVDSEFFKHFASIVKYLQVKSPESLQHLIKAIPEESYKDDRFCSLKHQYSKPKVWSDKSIVIFCGEAWEEWASPSVVSGIGGSEEAVIYLSRELQKLGYEVTVFNSCGELAGTYEGVTYREYHEMNPNDTFNIIVGWRNNIFVENNLKAKKKLYGFTIFLNQSNLLAMSQRHLTNLLFFLNIIGR